VPSLRPDLDLEDVKNVCISRRVRFLPYYQIRHDENMMERIQQLLKLHPEAEGFVLKDGPHGRWYKYKVTRTMETLITGTTEGKGKFLGLLGSLRCSVYHPSHADGRLVEIARVSGMTDDERTDLTLSSRTLQGKVAEIKYDRVDSGGRLRHPRFVRLRDDRTDMACVSEQDPRLYDILQRRPLNPGAGAHG
jgi:ATP-dependent DNA ligase